VIHYHHFALDLALARRHRRDTSHLIGRSQNMWKLFSKTITLESNKNMPLLLAHTYQLIRCRADSELKLASSILTPQACSSCAQA
jgi:hypothetical protein